MQNTSGPDIQNFEITHMTHRDYGLDPTWPHIVLRECQAKITKWYSATLLDMDWVIFGHTLMWAYHYIPGNAGYPASKLKISEVDGYEFFSLKNRGKKQDKVKLKKYRNLI